MNPRLYASHTDNIVVKIDDNTSQMKGNLENMQSDASRIDARLKVLQQSVQNLERHLDEEERKITRNEGQIEDEQEPEPINLSNAETRSQSYRMSVASYNSSLRRSLRHLESIISSNSAMSRVPSMLSPPFPSQPGWMISG